MKLRVARHTKNLVPIRHFYVDLLGLDILGSFSSHDKYDGLFIGQTGSDWHLEFTISDHSPQHKTDPDDLLVFYFETEGEIAAICQRMHDAGMNPIKATNPYWDKNGTVFLDPDGFGVVLALRKL